MDISRLPLNSHVRVAPTKENGLTKEATGVVTALTQGVVTTLVTVAFDRPFPLDLSGHTVMTDTVPITDVTMFRDEFSPRAPERLQAIFAEEAAGTTPEETPKTLPPVFPDLVALIDFASPIETWEDAEVVAAQIRVAVATWLKDTARFAESLPEKVLLQQLAARAAR